MTRATDEPAAPWRSPPCWEAAYGEVPADRRRELHGVAARVLEEVHAQRREEVILSACRGRRS